MPTISPISDLRNYSEVLRKVDSGKPVFLTKNGHGKYVIISIEEYDKVFAAYKLMAELDKGRQSGESKGYIAAEDVERYFANKQK